MNHDATPTLVEQLSRPEAYAEHPREIVLHETHISWVFVTEQFAYKLKKPVRFDFLDYSTAEKRRAACEAELRLNRRLARDVYLDVLPITRDDVGSLHVAGVGPTVDWAVRMRRLADEERLDCLIRDGHVSEADLERVAARLATFYRQAPGLAVDAGEYRAAIESHVRANRRELAREERGLPQDLVERVHQAQLRCLALAPALLERRVREGRIIDGHGDLRPEHIYLLEPPVAIDCIEFNDEFRRLDAADELAFLAMECDRLGASSLGARLFDSCCRATGDEPPARLVTFFKSYRAAVRAKVHALRADQAQGSERERALQEAISYLELADSYRDRSERPLLLVVGGLMGTGKSTLAEALARQFGTAVFSTDAIRHELFGQSQHPAGFGEGHYTPEARMRVYRELIARARASLDRGLSLVLDGTFLGGEAIEQVEQLAEQGRGAIFRVRATCPREIALERIRARAAAGGSLSEARPELFAQQQAAAAASGTSHVDLEVDTTDDLALQVRRVCTTLAERYRVE
ncbi:MAG: AAA family ATPase [Pirellulales bacterium]|nr:AAA family ATPase [Pirellulales bacterium]